jgi:hypothetical protein
MTYVDALSELEDLDEAAWCDLVFDIIEHGFSEQNADSGPVAWIKGRALANLRGGVIGFGFEIPLNSWHASPNQKPGGPRFHWRQIKLVSLGEATDKLVSSYAMWFHRQEMRRPARVASHVAPRHSRTVRRIRFDARQISSFSLK